MVPFFGRTRRRSRRHFFRSRNRLPAILSFRISFLRRPRINPRHPNRRCRNSRTKCHRQARSRFRVSKPSPHRNAHLPGFPAGEKILRTRRIPNERVELTLRRKRRSRRPIPRNKNCRFEQLRIGKDLPASATQCKIAADRNRSRKSCCATKGKSRHFCRTHTPPPRMRERA